MWCDMGADETPQTRGLRLSKASRSELKKRIKELEDQLASATAPPSTIVFTQRVGDSSPQSQTHVMDRGETRQVTLYRMYQADGTAHAPAYDTITVEVTLQ